MAEPTAPRIVVITGASSGIGRATALAFARAGDQLVLVARRQAELDATLAACGGVQRGRCFVADVSDRAQVQALAESVATTEGRCDVLVNNAGVGARTGFEGPEQLDVLERVMAVNFFGAAYAIGELLPLLSQSPRAAIVNVTSIAGIYAVPGSPIYCASKFALNGFGESLHFALRGRGIHVANVQPGPVPTEGFPHERLMRTRRARVLTATPEQTAALIVRSARPGSRPFPILPRIYRLGVIARAVAPPLYRAMLARAASRIQMSHRID